MDAEAILRSVSFFEGLPHEAQRALAEIAVPRRAARGEVLFLEEQEGHSMYVLAEGHVQLTRVTPEGREIVLKVVTAGETFAEAVLFENDTYPATATVLAPSTLLLLPRRQVLCLLEQETFRNAFLTMLLKRLRYLADRIVYLTSEDVEERFFRFLRESYGEAAEYQMSLQKKDIAAAIGTNPETFSRLLARLRADGKITWRGRLLGVRKGLWEELDIG